MVFYINTTWTGETYISTDPAHCHIERPEVDAWVLKWEDWIDNDFDDFVISIENTSTYPEGIELTWVEFTATTSEYYTNVRSGPGFSYPVAGKIKPNTKLTFEGYTYGTKVTDIWLGTPDYRWYKIAGKDWWVSSAVVMGNAPGSSPVPYGPSPLSDGTNVTQQSSEKAAKAVDWAKKQAGKSTFELVGGGYSESKNYCALFVATAYREPRTGAPINPKAGVPTASTLYQELDRLGSVKREGEPELGALIFFDYAQKGTGINYGHVAIYIGDGKAICAGGDRVEPLTNYRDYRGLPCLGWSPPPSRWRGRK
jgi:cell wall-associated NlpC family hydrolase